MSATRIGICNSALAKVGAKFITALTDDTKAAIYCQQQYARLRDEVLRAHPWNFALARVSLAADASWTDALEEWDYRFPLPGNVLRVVKTSISDPWKVEGRYLLANDSEIAIQAIVNDASEGVYDPMFAECLALRMAADLAYVLSNNATLSATLMQAYKAMIPDARTIDAQEGAGDEVEVSTWLNSRY
jgi:hypothetical protein